MPKANHLTHALHNVKVCNYLHKKEEFGDWIIVTAFYAALHFVNHVIFHFTIMKADKSIQIDSVEDYIHHLRVINSKSKHAILTDLVVTYHPSIAVAYSRLKDLSFQARYQNYQFSRAITDFAKAQMDEIKNYCIANNK